MTVYRCNQCGAVAETTQPHGSETVCANCQQPVQVLDTVLYIKDLLKKYSALYQQLRKVQAERAAANQDGAVSQKAQPVAAGGEKGAGGRADMPRLPADVVEKIRGIFADGQKIKVALLATEMQKVLPDFDQTQYGFKKKFSDFVRQCDFLEVRGEKHDMAVSLKGAGKSKAAEHAAPGGLNDTDLFANKEQHEHIKKWLHSKNIAVTFDYAAVDMSGYFDESAELIGDNFPLLEKHLKTIRYLYSNDKKGLTIDCAALPPQDSQKLQEIFRQLYEYTVIAKYSYRADEQKIRMTLNVAEPVKRFFTGGWLEWFATIKLLKEARAKGKQFSIARSVVVQHGNGDKHEFDVVFMPEGETPIFIECKSGEFRQSLDKYIRICKKFALPTQNWLLLAAEIDEKQAAAFEKMYPVRFCGMSHFLQKVQPLI